MFCLGCQIERGPFVRSSVTCGKNERMSTAQEPDNAAPTPPPSPEPAWAHLTIHCLPCTQRLPGPAAGPRHPAPPRAGEHLRRQHHREGGVHRGRPACGSALRRRHGCCGGQDKRKPRAGQPQSDSGCRRDSLQAPSPVSTRPGGLPCPPFLVHFCP